MEGIVCGPGGKYNTMPGERVELRDYLDAVRLYLMLIIDICGPMRPAREDPRTFRTAEGAPVTMSTPEPFELQVGLAEGVTQHGTEALMSDYAAQIRPTRGRRHSVK